MCDGIDLQAKMLIAAGAKTISTGIVGLEPYVVKNKETALKDPKFKEYLQKSRELTRKGFNRAMFSAHQMGTCKMGTNPSNSVINPNGESWNVQNLFVADASTFPTPSGSNPMMTIEAISHFISGKIVQRLKELERKEIKPKL